jgi:DNA (cytosine-5)-methyltransferase 1
LVELGYGFAYRVLDAQHFGVPQRRRRVFVVACLGDWRAAAEVLSLREGLRGYLETGNKKRKGPAADAGASVEAGGEGVAFRKSKRACSTTDNETWVPADASNTLNNFDLGDTRTTHAVVQPIAWTQNQREEVRLLGDKVGAIALPGTHQTNYIAEPVHQMPGSVAPTIGASGPPYSRTGNERVEAEALAVTFQPGNLRREAGADPSFTTTTTLKASAGDQTPHVATPMAVRRLTPVECERLQGFPDNWSRIPWKGKPETECPDGPRYKACGNSMAVPVMRWIGERIAAVDCTLSPHA